MFISVCKPFPCLAVQSPIIPEIQVIGLFWTLQLRGGDIYLPSIHGALISFPAPLITHKQDARGKASTEALKINK